MAHTTRLTRKNRTLNFAIFASDSSKPPNGGVDAAARIQSSIAGPIMIRNTLPPLASNDLLCAVLLADLGRTIQIDNYRCAHDNQNYRQECDSQSHRFAHRHPDRLPGNYG